MSGWRLIAAILLGGVVVFANRIEFKNRHPLANFEGPRRYDQPGSEGHLSFPNVVRKYIIIHDTQEKDQVVPTGINGFNQVLVQFSAFSPVRDGLTNDNFGIRANFLKQRVLMGDMAIWRLYARTLEGSILGRRISGIQKFKPDVRSENFSGIWVVANTGLSLFKYDPCSVRAIGGVSSLSGARGVPIGSDGQKYRQEQKHRSDSGSTRGQPVSARIVQIDGNASDAKGTTWFARLLIGWFGSFPIMAICGWRAGRDIDPAKWNLTLWIAVAVSLSGLWVYLCLGTGLLG